MGRIIYITGLSGSGKTTIGKELQKQIPHSIHLDGDEIRVSMNTDLGFSTSEKTENIRRNNALIKLLSDQGHTVICSFMASVVTERDKLFIACPHIITVQLSTSVTTCAERDPKGYYSKKLINFAGITTEYVPIDNPNLTLDTTNSTVESCVKGITQLYNQEK